MKVRMEKEIEELKKVYEVRYRDGKHEGKKSLVLEELTQEEMDGVNLLIGDLKLVDSGNVEQNILSLNVQLSKEHFYGKLFKLILHTADGKRCSEEFFKTCIQKDLDRISTDFFGGEGSSIISGIAGMMLSPLLKKMQQKS